MKRTESMIVCLFMLAVVLSFAGIPGCRRSEKAVKPTAQVPPQPTAATKATALSKASAPSAEAVQHYEAGLKAKEAKDYENARGELTKALELSPEYAEAHHALAWVCLAQKEKDKAIAEFKEVLRLAPEGEKGREAAAALQRLGVQAPQAESTPQIAPTGSATLGDVSKLIEQLQKGKTPSRRSAAKQLGKLGSAASSATSALIRSMAVTEKIEFAMPSLGNPSGKIVGQKPALMGPCCEALLSIGEPAKDEVVAGLDSKDRWIRYGCAWVLGRLGGKSVVPALTRILEKKGEDENVRIQVADSLALIGDAQAAPSAARALEKAPMESGGFAAVLRLLVATDADAASTWCVKLLEPKQPGELREVAARTAARLKDRATRDALLRAVNDSHGMTALEACHSLGIRREKRALTSLRSAALHKSRNAGLRVRAAWAIASMGDSRGEDVLKDLAKNGPDFAQSAAEEALTCLKQGRPFQEPEKIADAVRGDARKFGGRFLNVGNGLHVVVE